MLRGDTLPEVVHAKVAPRYDEELRDARMSREFAKAKWVHYIANGTSLRKIPSLTEQRAYLRNLDIGPSSNVPEAIDDVENS